MKTYSVKIRCFPPPAELAEWLEQEPEDWVWELSCGYRTEYGRPITDENGREGVSVKLVVDADTELHPSQWSWHNVARLDENRVEFVRAVEVESQNLVSCYQCSRSFPESQAWLDIDSDMFCSKECILAFYDSENEPYMIDPQGTVHNA